MTHGAQLAIGIPLGVIMAIVFIIIGEKYNLFG
jgi:hypothetical protein